MKPYNEWHLVSRWGENKGSFLTLHEKELDGFAIRGMEAAVHPTSLEPHTFHAVNITFVPRPGIPGEEVLRLKALFIVAPRGAELSCVGFLPGSVGNGTGPAGWTDAERIACDEADEPKEDSACTWPGFSPPRGLWTACLTFPSRPYWDTVVERGVDRGLWLVVSTMNPSYLPSDNVWALAVIGEREHGYFTSDADRLIDASGMEGYNLYKFLSGR